MELNELILLKEHSEKALSPFYIETRNLIISNRGDGTVLISPKERSRSHVFKADFFADLIDKGMPYTVKTNTHIVHSRYDSTGKHKLSTVGLKDKWPQCPDSYIKKLYDITTINLRDDEKLARLEHTIKETYEYYHKSWEFQVVYGQRYVIREMVKPHKPLA